MWLSQRISAINKQLRKPTKSHSTTLPSKVIITQSKSLQTNKPISPPLSPDTKTKAPSLPFLPLSIDSSPTKTPLTSSTANNTPPAQVALFTQNIPLEILVIGTSQVAKSAVIRLAFDNVRSVSSNYKGGHTFQANLAVDQSIYHLDLVKMDYANALDSKYHPPKIRNDFIHFDGIIVCYDTNDSASMDCLPDLLSAFLAWKIPSFLVGLKTATTTCDTENPQMGKKLAALYGTPFVSVDGVTPEGEMQMQTIYTALVQKIIYPQKRTSSLATNASRRHHRSSTAAPQSSLQEQQQQQQQQQQQSTRKRNSNKQAASSSLTPTTTSRKRESGIGRKSSSSSSSSKKSQHKASRIPRSEHRYDLLALASIDDIPTATAISPPPPPPPPLPSACSETISAHDPLSGMLTPPLSPISPTTASLPLISPETNDSPDSYKMVHLYDIVPTNDEIELTANDIVQKLILWDYHDQESSTMIFLMFYRKFMTPYQLLQALIERFEQNYSCEHQPTREQERIRTILCLWLSHYWGDIYYGRSHQTLNNFLQRLGHNPQLLTMYQLLVPLITRPGPLSDPDSVWGLTDEDEEEIDNGDSSLNNHGINNNFSSLWTHSPSITAMLSMSTSFQSIANKYPSAGPPRSASTTLLDWYTETEDDDNHLHHSFSTHTLVTSSPSNSSSQPALSTTSSSSVDSCDTFSSYTSKSKRNKDKKRGNTSTKSAKTTSKRRSSSKRPANCAALFGGGLVLLETAGRRPFSLLALQSSLYSMSHIRYAMLMDLSVDLLAEQLTWVELTLYRNIKPRSYIRHLWGEKGASEAMVAFISHGQFIKGWVMTTILVQNHHCQRIALVDRFIDLAYRLYHDYRNYNTLASVLEGLNQVISGLDDGSLLLELDQVKQQQWQELETLMKADRNYLLYRQDLEFSNDGSCIPYLWVHRQDIVTLAEMKRDVTKCGGIHWDKFRFMGEIILRLTQTVTLATTTQPNPCVLAFISDTTLLTEEERICRLDELREK